MIANQQFTKAVAIVKSDTVNLPKQGTSDNLTSAIYVGGAGDVVVVFQDDSTATFTVTTVPFILPVKAKRVNSTSTTATLMLALYAL